MKPAWIARQSRRPSGWLGEIVARVMARETRAANVFALSQLPAEQGRSLLVLGFRPDDPEARASLPGSVWHLRSASELEELLRETGFDELEVATTKLGWTPFVCLRAHVSPAEPFEPKRSGLSGSA